MTRAFRRRTTGLIATAAIVGTALSAAPTTGHAATTGQVVQLNAPTVIRAEYLVGGRVTVSVTPVDYVGTVTVRTRTGTSLGSALVRGGTAVVDITAPDLGRIPVVIGATASDGNEATTRSTIVSRGVTLWPHERSPAVAGLLTLLRDQHYLTPASTDRFSPRVEDVVRAFQKVHGLKATGRVTPSLWQEVSTAEPVESRDGGRGTHLEVDKTRQIMMVVRNGTVRATIHVSTGNLRRSPTPEGRFRIYAKNVGTLFRFMPFKGNYGFHGYPLVPIHPASHGCIREPMWAADWIYDQTRVGTPVHIYS